MFEKIILTESSEETFELGRKIGKSLTKKKGRIIGFTGDLGAGKTIMIKGIVSFLAPEQEVTSPTYTLMNQYEKDNINIYHVDLYRIDDGAELFGTGFFEILEDDSAIILVEWIDRLDLSKLEYFSDLISIDIKHAANEKREIKIKNLELNN